MNEWDWSISLIIIIAFCCRVDKEDEMECLIRGCNFLLRNISNEVFEFHREQKPPYVFQDLDHSELFPYLLVNIGSGVSIVKVTIL